MLRKLSLAAVAAVSLGVAALAPTSASAWVGGMEAGMVAGTMAIGVRASMPAARPITVVMAAAMPAAGFRPPGVRVGGS